MQRFELIEGKSSKFWEVQTEGESLTVRYGRIGTHGQTQTKTFASADAALKERDKLIKEKTGKGYAEVSVANADRRGAQGAERAARAEGARPTSRCARRHRTKRCAHGAAPERRI